MTGTWAKMPAYPKNTENPSEIICCLSKNMKHNSSKNYIKYDTQHGTWTGDKKYLPYPEL